MLMVMQRGSHILNEFGLLVVDHVSAMLAYWDKNLICRFANKSYLEWFGKKREDMIDKMTIQELLGPLYPKNERYIIGVLQGHPQTFEREIPIPGGGGTRYSLANYFPHIVDGEVEGFFVHVADISFTKLLEEKLRAKNKGLLNFANTVSHNLQSYASNFAGILDLMEHAKTENEKQQMILHLKTVSKAFSATVANLSEIADVENHGALKMQPVNLYQSIETVCQILKIQIENSNAVVLNKVARDLMVNANAAYLESIILNLLTNAIKYHQPGRYPVIEFDCSTSSTNELVLKVRDNGLGINLPKYKDQLFGVFKTFHGNKDAKGIGLYITKFQVEAMGGQIDVESEELKGSTFIIRFMKA